MPPQYTKALDVQLDLIRFWQGYWGPRVAGYWVKHLSRQLGGGDNDDGRMTFDYGTPEHFARREAEALNSASTYWVAPPMVDLLDTIRNTMPSYELRSNDIPSRRGFAYFGTPLYMRDKHGKRCNLVAFSWAVEPLVVGAWMEGERVKPAPLTEEEVEAAFEMDVRPVPEEDRISQEEQLRRENEEVTFEFATPVIRRADGSYLAKAVRFFVYSDKRDPNDDAWGADKGGMTVEEIKNMIPYQWSLFHVDTWMLNQMLPDADDPDLRGTDSFLRIVAAFWTMCNQKVTWNGGMGLDRSTRRRAARQMNPVPADIRVVTLRRMVGQPRYDGTGEEMHYSHSFWVGKEHGGFLRNQWYPSEGRHKPKWIMPFIKGDGPLIEKDTVHVVRR